MTNSINDINQNINFENNSGKGSGVEVPPEVANNFNWGAFCLSWIWGIGNQTWIALIALPLCFLNIIPFVWIISVAFCCWLGVKGNTFAWQNHRWQSIEEFHRIQKIWAIVGICIVSVYILLMIIGMIAALTIPTLLNATDDQKYKISAKKAISVLNQSCQLNIAMETPIPYIITGESLAKYFNSNIKGNLTNNKITTTDGMLYQFEARSSDCSNNTCFILVDFNGTQKGPNTFWDKNSKQPSDRIMLNLQKSKSGFEVIYPDFINNDKNSRPVKTDNGSIVPPPSPVQ